MAAQYLDLPLELRQPMADAVGAVRFFMPPDRLVLGGGTVLAARWHHRKSTDLDFTAQEEALNELLYRDLDELNSLMLDLLRQDVIQAKQLFGANLNGIQFAIGTTNVSIVRDRFEPVEELTQLESQTEVKLESTSHILLKKLAGRLLDWGSLVDRDVYDLLLSSNFDLPALLLAYSRLDHLRLASTLQILCQDPNLDENMPGVIDPLYSVAEPYDQLQSMFQSGLRDLPHIQPLG